MKITRKQLKILVEKYLFEQANEGLEDFTYTIQQGDVLGRVAQRFNTTAEEIVNATVGLENANRIRVGQVVVIPDRGYYTVVSGDNLSTIAQRFNTTVNAIQTANSIDDINSISLNQRLIIPLNVEEESEEESEDDNRHDISHYRDIVSEDLLNSLKISEGLSATRTRPPGRPALTAYLDNENVWTIGWGHADTSGREPIPSRGMQIGEQRAEEILEDDIQHFREAVADSDIYRDSSDNDREARLTQHEFDALVSASFNAGVAGIGNHRDGTNGNRSIGRQILDGVHLNPDSDEYADFQNLFINARIGNNDGVRNRRQREWDMFSEENYHLTDDIELPED